MASNFPRNLLSAFPWLGFSSDSIGIPCGYASVSLRLRIGFPAVGTSGSNCQVFRVKGTRVPSARAAPITHHKDHMIYYLAFYCLTCMPLSCNM